MYLCLCFVCFYVVFCVLCLGYVIVSDAYVNVMSVSAVIGLIDILFSIHKVFILSLCVFIRFMCVYWLVK